MFEQEIASSLIPQSLVALPLWLLLYYLVGVVASRRLQNRSIPAGFVQLYFLLLSTIAVVRMFIPLLPRTSDSYFYLSLAEAIRDGYDTLFQGASVYAYVISWLAEFTFGNLFFVLFVNAAIFCIAVVELLRLLPEQTSLWGRNLVVAAFIAYPAVYWFIPNVLREALFVLAIVLTFSTSWKILHRSSNLHHYVILVLAAGAAALLRPQVLLILIIWALYLVYNRWPWSIWSAPLIAFAGWKITAIRDTLLSKVSFAYLEAFKMESAAGLPEIRFSDQVIPTNWQELITWLPYVFVRFLLAPWPWQPASIGYTFAWLDALFCFTLLLTLLWRAFHREIFNWHLVAYAALFIAVFSVF